jgi:hypothetical protein
MTPAQATADRNTPTPVADEEFSLVLGGPLYQLLLKTRLANPSLGLLHRRMLVISALAWLPLLVLTFLEGHALGGVSVPFLLDIEAYARFLIALPILLLAELVVHRRVREIIRQFRERCIVSAESMPRFEDTLQRTMRLRNSLFAEIALLAIVFLVGPWTWQHGLALQTDTWYAGVDAGRTELTLAGWWFIYVSAPMFQFLLLRWYFRLALWWGFLWKISHIPLELRALHPDHAGGLDFLGDSISAFMPVLFAQGVVVSGIVASRVVTGARSALEFRDQIIVMIILMVASIIIPLLFFSPQLIASRRVGQRKFGALATAYVSDFDRKWMAGSMPATEPLVGNADVQSLADLAGSNDIVREMRTVPFGLRVFVFLVLATAAPFFPLVLTVIPLGELVRDAAGLLL